MSEPGPTLPATPAGVAAVAGSPVAGEESAAAALSGAEPGAEAGTESGAASGAEAGAEAGAESAASGADEIVLHQSPLMYRLLLTPGGDLELEAVVGGIALSTVRLPLDASERSAYEVEGASYLDRLARALIADPRFGGRSRAG